MRWETWEPHYDKIARRLKLDKEADEEAAKLLNGLLPEADIRELKRIVQGRECIVFGAGPSLEGDLEALNRAGYLDRVLIPADGATTAVLRYRDPEIIVTDLDGAVIDQMGAWRRGSWLVIHGHGDNIDKIKEVMPEAKERVMGTTQTRAFGRLHNFGGFTDGDRAAFMAHELGASRIYLAGMDLGREIGKHSGFKDPARKIVKLEICGELLAWLAGGLGAELVNLTSGGINIENVPKRRV